MTIAQTYLAAADLIETHGWVQGDYARDQGGAPVPSHDASAICFCFAGALMRVSPGGSMWTDVLALGYRVLGDTIINWNDEPRRTKADVIAMARAIGWKAEKEGL